MFGGEQIGRASTLTETEQVYLFAGLGYLADDSRCVFGEEALGEFLMA